MKSNGLIFFGWMVLVAIILFAAWVISVRKSAAESRSRKNKVLDYCIFAASIVASPLFFPFTLLPFVAFCICRAKRSNYQNHTSENNVISTNVIFLSIFSSSMMAMLYAMTLAVNLGSGFRDRLVSFVRAASPFMGSIPSYTEYGEKFFTGEISDAATFSLLVSPYFNLLPLLILTAFFFNFPGHLENAKERLCKIIERGQSEGKAARRAIYVLSAIAIGVTACKFITYFLPMVPSSQVIFFRYPLSGEFFYFLDGYHGIISTIQFSLLNASEVMLILPYLGIVVARTSPITRPE